MRSLLTAAGHALATPAGLLLAIDPAAVLEPWPTASYAYAVHFVADNLPGVAGSVVSNWPNSGTAGSAFNLTAVVGANGPAVLRVSAGGAGELPAGRKYVEVPAGTYFTASTSPLSGNQSRVLWTVAKPATMADQDFLKLGSSGSGLACGIYRRGATDGYAWWIYGQNNTIRQELGEWEVALWRGRVEADRFGVYVRDSEMLDPTNLASSFVNTDATGTLQLGGPYFFNGAATAYAEVGIDPTFPTGAPWVALKSRFPDRYGLSL